VDDALGDALAVEARQLFDEVVVLQQRRSARTGGLRILVSATGAPLSVVRIGWSAIVASGDE
jgi:hypothetical protein